MIMDSEDGSVKVFPKKFKIPQKSKLAIRKPSISGISELSRQVHSQMSDSCKSESPKSKPNPVS
jgi:hypothetical protein